MYRIFVDHQRMRPTHLVPPHQSAIFIHDRCYAPPILVRGFLLFCFLLSVSRLLSSAHSFRLNGDTLLTVSYV